MAKVDADITVNRKALRDYHVLDTYEAGIELRGTEVKSVRNGHLNLQDAFARVDKGEVWLHQSDILPYDKASYGQHEGRRPRRLLLHKREILKLQGQSHNTGMTLVALKAYWKNHKVKVQIGLCKGKAAHDKREDLKKKEAQRDIDRALAARQRRR